MTDSTDDAPALDFVNRFAELWREPSTERMAEILTDDVVLIQPLSRPMYGLPAAQAEFARLWRWLPDLRATIDSWGAHGDEIFIRFRLHATVGGKRLEWPVIDHFEMRGDLASRRVTYFDSAPLLAAIARRPRAWLGWLRSRQ